MRRSQIAIVAVLCAAPAAAPAQVQTTFLGPGAHVRVWVPDSGWSRHRAVLAELTEDTLVLVADSIVVRRGRTQRLQLEHRVPVTAVQRIEVMTGQHPNVIGGLKWGSLIGAGVGLVLGVAAYATTSSDEWFDYGPEIIPAATLGCGFWGSVIGLVVGALDRTEEWQQIWLAPARRPTAAGPRLQLAPRRDSFGIGVAMTF